MNQNDSDELGALVDFCNIWAREAGVEEAAGVSMCGLARLIGRLWDASSRARLHPDACVAYFRATRGEQPTLAQAEDVMVDRAETEESADDSAGIEEAMNRRDEREAGA